MPAPRGHGGGHRAEAAAGGEAAGGGAEAGEPPRALAAQVLHPGGDPAGVRGGVGGLSVTAAGRAGRAGEDRAPRPRPQGPECRLPSRFPWRSAPAGGEVHLGAAARDASA